MKQHTIIQISAGNGPTECCHVVAKILKLFIEELGTLALKHTILHKVAGDVSATLQSALILVEGDDAIAKTDAWIGTILWKGQSSDRPNHKRHNWFIGMNRIDRKIMADMSESDISYQAMRSQGPGGQNVNKVNSAIRAVHVPTGLSVQVMDTRSQHENKKIAMARLSEKWKSYQLEIIHQSAKNEWQNHSSLQRGNPVKTFEGTDFKPIKQKSKFRNERSRSKDDLRSALKNINNERTNK